MSKFKGFICNSELIRPRTITYGAGSIASVGEGVNRHICLRRNGVALLRLWVNTNTANDVCFIRSIDSWIPDTRLWLNETCTRVGDEIWRYHTWEDVDKLMWKLVDYIRNKK